jgi:phospholipase C
LAGAGPKSKPSGARSVVTAYLSDIASEGLSGYDLSVFGPNGFFRRFQGSTAGKNVSDLSIEVKYERSIEGIELKIKNPDKSAVALQITDAYQGHDVKQTLRGHEEFVGLWNLQKNFGWYDLTVELMPTLTSAGRSPGIWRRERTAGAIRRSARLRQLDLLV